jgi:hypothetical protein
MVMERDAFGMVDIDPEVGFGEGWHIAVEAHKELKMGNGRPQPRYSCSRLTQDGVGQYDIIGE